MPRSSRIKVEKKVSGWTRHVWQFYRISPLRSDISGPRLDMSTGHFQRQCLMTILAIFVSLRGPFLRSWLVCSLHYCRVLALGFELGT
jgi:hypothetical protein